MLVDRDVCSRRLEKSEEEEEGLKKVGHVSLITGPKEPLDERFDSLDHLSSSVSSAILFGTTGK